MAWPAITPSPVESTLSTKPPMADGSAWAAGALACSVCFEGVFAACSDLEASAGHYGDCTAHCSWWLYCLDDVLLDDDGDYARWFHLLLETPRTTGTTLCTVRDGLIAWMIYFSIMMSIERECFFLLDTPGTTLHTVRDWFSAWILYLSIMMDISRNGFISC